MPPSLPLFGWSKNLFDHNLCDTVVYSTQLNSIRSWWWFSGLVWFNNLPLLPSPLFTTSYWYFVHMSLSILMIYIINFLRLSYQHCVKHIVCILNLVLVPLSVVSYDVMSCRIYNCTVVQSLAIGLASASLVGQIQIMNGSNNKVRWNHVYWIKWGIISSCVQIKI